VNSDNKFGRFEELTRANLVFHSPFFLHHFPMTPPDVEINSIEYCQATFQTRP
jgi:hypothetical protein